FTWAQGRLCPASIRSMRPTHTSPCMSPALTPRASTNNDCRAEFAKCEDIILNSDLFKEAMTEFSLPEGFVITVGPWPCGGADGAGEPRYMQGLVFAKDASKKNDDTNHYGFPIPIIPIIDWVT